MVRVGLPAVYVFLGSPGSFLQSAVRQVARPRVIAS